MHLLSFYIALLPLIFLLPSTSGQPLVETIQQHHTCQIKKYAGVLYDEKFMLESGYWVAYNFEQCVELCIQSYDCKAVNYAAVQNLCGPLSQGMTSTANTANVGWNPGVIHAYITCDGPHFKPSTNGSVGCGVQGASYKPTGLPKITRIIGGKDANPHSWPWLVTLDMIMRNGNRSFCGSSLLRVRDNVEESDILLTAAHCVTKSKTMSTIPEKYDADRFTLMAGNHLRSAYEVGQQEREGAEIRFHPGFIFHSLIGAHNDVALIKLDKPIRFTDTIRPICLPAQGEAIPTGKTCVAAGWGRINSQTSDVPDAVQQLVIPVHDASKCAGFWTLPQGTIYKEDQMICAGDPAGTSGTCQGDSGGMLACRDANSDWTLYGATSFGIGELCVAPDKPSVFARISNYVDWINTNMMQMTSL